MPSRRRLLVTTGTAIAIAGCLAGLNSGGSGSTPPELAAGEQTRAEGEEISTRTEVDSPEYEYIESNNTVRYPATGGGWDEPEYSHEPFEDWAHVKSATEGAIAVHEHLVDQVASMDHLNSSVAHTDESNFELLMKYNVAVDDSGDVVAEPDVSLSQLINETPKTVESTIRFAGRTATHRFSVFVRYVEVEQLGPATNYESRSTA
ncbi:hypothetical protein [Haloarchaeobius litoreus]|uniref:Tat (Twin-arginine translocation) pathway signal sequence n=1 Tax=Haloarchaeobius litoreus TaxID=755306 RepID=A0ABD6DQK3_9EURY|nr:hypothetical protein [Haloarchaeobius litoreus]